MNNLSTHTATCPAQSSWCQDHFEDQCQSKAHTFVDAMSECRQELRVQLVRLAEPGEPETTYVTILTRGHHSELWEGLHPDALLSPAGAAWLGSTLSEVAAQADGALR